jgi:hypothetical protein
VKTHTLLLQHCLTYPLKRAAHVFPALCPGPVTLERFPFGQSPFLHCLRSRTGGFVRQLRQYYETVRLPMPVHHRCASLDFPMRSVIPSLTDRHGISRFPLKVLACMHRVLDRARSKSVSPYRRSQSCLPPISTASAPRSSHRFRGGVSISRLNGWPARTPVNASPSSLRPKVHDSKPVWIATPSLCETFIHNTLPAFTGAIRNPKQIPMLKIQNSKPNRPRVFWIFFVFGFGSPFVSDFVFRISCYSFSRRTL